MPCRRLALRGGAGMRMARTARWPSVFLAVRSSAADDSSADADGTNLAHNLVARPAAPFTAGRPAADVRYICVHSYIEQGGEGCSPPLPVCQARAAPSQPVGRRI